MQRHAASVTKAIGDISEVVGGLFGNVRYGLVLYRDRVEGRLVPDEDVHRMTKILAKLEPDDGGRPSEGVDRALQSATSDKMGWDQRRARSIVVVGDEGPPEKRRDAQEGGKEDEGERGEPLDAGWLALLALSVTVLL